ncbi:histidine kinase, partial [Bacteroidota bacterium]
CKNYEDYWHVYTIKKNGKKIFSKSLESVFPNDYNFFGKFVGICKDEHTFIVRGNMIIHIKDSIFLNIKFLSEEIIWISIDNKNLWIGTYNGIFWYNDLNLNKQAQILLKDKGVSSVLNDKEGGYWFSTLFDGIYYLPNTQVKTLKKSDGLMKNEVTSLAHDSTILWLGFHDSYIQGIKSSRIIEKIKLDESNIVNYDLFYDNNKNKLWIGSQTLSTYQKSVLKTFSIKDDYTVYNNVHAKDFLIDTNQNVWIASYSGLFKYSNDNNYILKKPEAFNHKINALCQKSNNTILLGLNNGLWEYSINTDDYKYLEEENELFTNKIGCMIQNKYHNNIWIGTRTNGIIIYDKDTIYNITTKHGLTNNNISSFYLKENIIWVGTQNGLNKITLYNRELKNDYKIERFNTMHGIASNEINDIYVGDSIVYLATKEGLTIADVNTLKSNNIAPPVYIKSIGINDKDTVIQNSYDLKYHQNSISIEFVGLMYRNNENKKYQYKISEIGQHANWIETSDNYVRLSFIPHGKYNFMVKAINEDGVKSKEPAILSFTINPPYWKTWWFISAIVFASLLLILVVLFAIYKVRIQEINRKNDLERKLLKEVNKFRQQALGQQMNPHFIFNTLNAIQYYIYENDTESSTKYLNKFSKLMRIILDNSQYDTIPIYKELDALQLYMELERVRANENFEFEITIDSDLDTSAYKICPLLIQPYVENAIWHGLAPKKEKGFIKIELTHSSDTITCSIEDNGIGREKAMEIKKQKKPTHKSHATNITSKRIEVLNKLYNRNLNVEFVDLKDDNGLAFGTKVILQIPKIGE